MWAQRMSTSAPLVAPDNLFIDPEKPVHINRIVQDFAQLQVGLNESGVLQMPVSSFTDNDSTGLIELDPSVFGAEFRPDILQRSVRWYLANRRAGTHKTKSRSEVRGSTRKMWAQKGSGRARVGDRRAPQWRGGYTVHGKTPRDYSFDLPKKVRRMGVRVALSAKLREGRLAVVDQLAWEEHKTKGVAKLMQERGWSNVLFLTGADVDANLDLACRALPNVDLMPQSKANVYSILQRDLLVASVEAIELLQSRLAVE